MLYLIKGRAGSGKTRLLRQKIDETLANTQSRPLLIVPEQFSFDTERSMLSFLGPAKLKKIDIFSFTRLALESLKNTPYFSKKIPDDGIRNLLMSEALFQLDGRLEVFSNIKPTVSALSPLVDFCKELKYCCIDSEEIDEKLKLVNEGYLKSKISEISLINEAYNALVSDSYFDDTDSVHLLSLIAAEKGLFKNKTVFIDGFRAFSKQEFECLEVIFSQADNVYFTLCTDVNLKKNSPFKFIKDFELKIRTVASNHNTIVQEIPCMQSDDVFAGDIFALEKALFSDAKEAVEADGSITVAECNDVESECKYVATQIKKLIRSGGYRCRDIAIIERTSGAYKNRLIEELKRLDVPVFDDNRRPLAFEPLFIYLKSILACISLGFTAENVFTYLKTGFSSLSLTEISKLEKYALIWGISGKRWTDDFTMHPDGFGNNVDERAQKRLDELNDIRKKAVLPLLQLKKTCDEKNCKEITEEIYNFLINQKVPEKLFDLYSALYDEGFPVEAQRQSVCWDILMNMLDTMSVFGDGKYITLLRYNQLFQILVESGDVGEIPQGLDEVKIGSADRIRTEQLKVVFLVGVNKDEFPLVSVKSGILTDSDRVMLTSLGLEIRPPFEETVEEERFIAYCAVTAASQKLFLTYKKINNDGTKALKSEIIETVLNSIDNISVVDTNACAPLDFVESENSAFTLLAKSFCENSSLKASLLEYFSKKESYMGKLQAMYRVAGNKKISFDDKNVSKELFGENIYLSASKVESFYNCPFAYFLRYGLKAEPLRIAELDPAQSGTIVHLVMETILKKYPKASFVEASDDELKAVISSVLFQYLEEKMGGEIQKSKRFMFLFNRLLDISMAIIERLKAEFKVGSFEPCDFELRIGGGDVPAYVLPLEKGSVKITGSVDRVDLMEKDGIKYVRIVDYKTGKKEFKLSELFDGLNIQMVLYLMAIEKNGKSYYGDIIPAGVLYLPSRIGVSNYLDKRAPSEENVAAQKRVSGKLSGMVLDSPVVFNGMGVDEIANYFPVGYKKDGSPRGSFYSLQNFRNLSNVIDKKIVAMGDALHNGKIAPVPCGSKGEGKMCQYCSYISVCGYEQGDEINEITNLSHSEAIERLEVEDNE